MKVPILYQPDPQEIEVEVSAEEISKALEQHPETLNQTLTLLNTIAQTLRGIDQNLINKLTQDHKRIIHEGFLEILERFKPSHL
jgi:ABC-type transporter Mla subunit MlaD